LRFLSELAAGDISLTSDSFKSGDALAMELRQRGYTAFRPIPTRDSIEATHIAASDSDGVLDPHTSDDALHGMSYLLRIPVLSMTADQTAKSVQTVQRLSSELSKVQDMSTEDMWLKDLDQLRSALTDIT
jgi:hypothetical protein